MTAKMYESIAICTFVIFLSDNLYLVEILLKICVLFQGRAVFFLAHFSNRRLEARVVGCK